MLISILIFSLIAAGVGIGLYVSTRRRGTSKRLVSLGTFTEPEAMVARDRLRSEGVWADVRHVGGVAVLSIELGSLRGYGLVVLAEDEARARTILGL